jgi:hypothetical protein
MVSQEDVLKLYRLILDREPENDGVVETLMGAESRTALLWETLRSEEFLGRYSQAILRTFSG